MNAREKETRKGGRQSLADVGSNTQQVINGRQRRGFGARARARGQGGEGRGIEWGREGDWQTGA